MSSLYPSFCSHHYEKCDGDEEELDVLENRLIQVDSNFTFSFNSSAILMAILIFSWNSQRTVHETKGWDVFRDPPIKIDSGSMANQACMEITAKILKLIAYILTFVLVLCGGVIAKGELIDLRSSFRVFI